MNPFAPIVLAAVAVGGAIGATGRWTIGHLWQHAAGGWPWSTLFVNVLGALAIGFAARRIDRNTVLWAFTVTGVLGGFTTFSAFAVELNDMADANRMGLAVTYAAVTLAAGVAATSVADIGRGRR